MIERNEPKTAGEKFFEALTNAEYRYMETYVGALAQNWEHQASGFDLNVATLIVAIKRTGEKVNEAEIKNLTPLETQKRLEETLERLGYTDDQDENDANLALTQES